MSKGNQYVGLDVSLKQTSICVIDDADKIVWRGQVDTTPEAIVSAATQRAPHAVRIGLESGQLSNWLFHGLKQAGLPVICVDARHAKAALSLKVNKTDANDALGLAQIMRVGWYREVTVKGLDCQAVRALLVARAQIVSQITTLKKLCARHSEDIRSGATQRLAQPVPGACARGDRGASGTRSDNRADVASAGDSTGATPRVRQGRHSTRSQRRHCPPADVGTGRRHGGCLGLYDRRRGSNALQAIVIGGGLLRDDAQALSIRRGRSRRAYLQVRRRHGARASVRGSQSVARSIIATKRAEDLGRGPRQTHRS